MNDPKSGHSLPPRELVLEGAEHTLGTGVVQAAFFSRRHALDDALAPEPPAPDGVLVLPAHVAVDDRPCAPGHSRGQPVEQLGLLGHVRALGGRPGDYLPGAEVVDRREVRLAPRLAELGDVGAHLLPGGLGGEVPPQHVPERLADRTPVGAVSAAGPFASDRASDPHLTHHPQHRLVGDARAPLRAQVHGDLPVAASVGRAGEDLGHRLPQLGARRAFRRPAPVAVVGRRGDACRRQQVADTMPFP